MIYVPDINYSCYVVLDKDTIRAYHDELINDNDIDYTDYYINSHYISKNGTIHYTSSEESNCISSNLLTNDFYYRNDIDNILLIFLIIIIFGFYIPFKIFKVLFRKGKN